MNYVVLLIIVLATAIFLIVTRGGLPWLFLGLLQGGAGLVVFVLQTLRIAKIPDGYTLPVVAAISTLGMVILLARQPERLKLFLTPLSVLILLFSVCVVVGIHYSWHHQALEKALKYLAANFVSFFVILSLPTRQRQQLYSLLVIVAVVLALGIMINLAVGGQGAVRGRYGAFGIETIAAGRIVALGFLIVLYSNRYRRYKWAQLIFLGMAVLLAASRGPVIALLGAVLLHPVLTGNGFSIYKMPRSTLWLLGTLLLAVGTLFLIIALIRPVVLADSWGPLRLLRSATFSDRNATVRLELWKIALQDIQISPLIGWGTAGYSGSLPLRDADLWLYPHNIFLEVVSEWGLLGLTLFILILLCCIYNISYAVRSARKMQTGWHPHETQVVAALFIFMLINACVSSEIYNNRTLWLALGMSEVLRYEISYRLTQSLNSQLLLTPARSTE